MTLKTNHKNFKKSSLSKDLKPPATLHSAGFTRKIEDFTCKHCGLKVKGRGFTNHCPNCLYSKHVDINPGDRLAGCGGMMQPINLETKGGKYVIVHRCVKCGLIKKNKTAASDNFEALLNLTKSTSL